MRKVHSSPVEVRSRPVQTHVAPLTISYPRYLSLAQKQSLYIKTELNFDVWKSGAYPL